MNEILRGRQRELRSVSVSFRDCLPCEQTIESLRAMARELGAAALVARISSRPGQYEIRVRVDGSVHARTAVATATSLEKALAEVALRLASRSLAEAAQPKFRVVPASAPAAGLRLRSELPG